MMRLQIVSAKGKAFQAVPNSSEIYRKMMISMKEHYEKQIQEPRISSARAMQKLYPTHAEAGWSAQIFLRMLRGTLM